MRSAVLRRDGFASMDAGTEGGTLVTRPITFRGRRLFVNVSAPSGELRGEVLTRGGRPHPDPRRDPCGCRRQARVPLALSVERLCRLARGSVTRIGLSDV